VPYILQVNRGNVDAILLMKRNQWVVRAPN